MSRQKLELTWIGKDEKLEIEPRILIEDKSLSNTGQDENTENMLIHGDNLLALKALETKYAGQVKCIYIDPPFNTGGAFEHYDDNLEHSIWLNLMYHRLQILYALLAEDGVIFVNLDDSESAYAKVMLDEIFSRDNYLNEIIVSTNKSFGFKSTSSGIFKQANHIFLFAKNKDIFEINQEALKVEKGYDPQYKWVFENMDADESEWTWRNINDIVAENLGYSSTRKAKQDLKDQFDTEVFDYAIKNNERVFRTASVSGGALAKRRETINKSREERDKILRHPNDDMDYMFIGGERVLFYRERLTELDGVLVPTELITDIWLDISVEGLAAEGGVSFPKGKKPEKLIQRCIELSTKKGDLVLDSFLGSGTTSSVAHKMGRRWIGIEMGEHAYTHCKTRLDSVIDGTDQTGISRTVNWLGGGGYRFYELAPTLIQKDCLGIEVINKAYNADMLAAAVALHEGFTYSPDEAIFWKQAKGTEESYLYVTTNHIDDNYLAAINSTMSEDEHLLIACTSFDELIQNKYKNISVKKIPQMLLSKCEYKEDGYPLNIISPPCVGDEEADDNE
jgi:adenine-specific DNA-methyltransferase